LNTNSGSRMANPSPYSDGTLPPDGGPPGLARCTSLLSCSGRCEAMQRTGGHDAAMPPVGDPRRHGDQYGRAVTSNKGDYSKSQHDCNTNAARAARCSGSAVVTAVGPGLSSRIFAPIRAFDERGGLEDLTSYDLLRGLQP
jgi:hypothetical protein